MSDARSFSDRVDLFLDQGPGVAPPDLLAEILAAVDAMEPRSVPGSRVRIRDIRWLPPRRSAIGLIATAIIILLAAVALMTGTGPFPSESPSPTLAGAVATDAALRTPDPGLSVAPSGTFAFQPCAPGSRLAGPEARDAFDPAEVRGRIGYSTGGVIWTIDPNDPRTPSRVDTRISGDPVSWSLDGTRLMVLAAGGANLPAAIALHADGSAVRLVDWGTAAFAPDGRSVVYSVPGGGLCLEGSDGSAPQLLAFDMAEPMDGSPAWSPDGATIAWLDFVEDSAIYGHHAYGLSLIDPDATDLRQLVVHFDWLEEGGGGIGWSPDGTRLAFWLPTGGPVSTGEVPDGDLGDGGGIWLVNADGSGLRQITTGEGDRWPTWSPGGDRIAFVRDGLIHLMTPLGTEIEELSGIRTDGPIAWNPAR